MSEIQNFTDFLDNLDYQYKILDTEDTLKAAIIISDSQVITITWLPNSTPAFEIDFPLASSVVTCNSFAQVQKNLNLYMSTKRDNFENILQLVNDMFCQQNSIDWDSNFTHIMYNVDDEQNLKILAFFTEDLVTNDAVVIEVKADYFIVQAGDCSVCYRYDANKNMAIKLPSLETCITSLVKLQSANPDKFEFEQTNPSQNIVVVFFGEPELRVEFSLGLCASAFLFETLYINDEEISLDFPLKQPSQLFDYKEKCAEAYSDYLLKQESDMQNAQEERKKEIVDALDNLVLRLFPNEEDVIKDYISVEIDYINLHLQANTHELNIMWDLSADVPFTYEFDTEPCGEYVDIDSLYDSIYERLNTEETTEEDNTWSEDNTDIGWENNTESDSWVSSEPTETIEEQEPTETDNNFYVDHEDIKDIPKSTVEPYHKKVGISLSESIQSVLEFTGANRSVRVDEIELAEQKISKILEPFSAAEILTILSKFI